MVDSSRSAVTVGGGGREAAVLVKGVGRAGAPGAVGSGTCGAPAAGLRPSPSSSPLLWNSDARATMPCRLRLGAAVMGAGHLRGVRDRSTRAVNFGTLASASPRHEWCRCSWGRCCAAACSSHRAATARANPRKGARPWAEATSLSMAACIAAVLTMLARQHLPPAIWPVHTLHERLKIALQQCPAWIANASSLSIRGTGCDNASAKNI